MKSDVKAIRKTDATSVFAGRTRLRGIILASTGSAGSVTLQDGNSVTQFQVDVPAGDVFSYNLAEDGILFEGGMTISAISDATTFAIDEIIEESYERIGLQNVSGNQLRMARRSLNIMFQEWGNRGLHYWEVANNSITLVSGQAEYTMFRSTGDGTSDATAVYGVDDILEAVYRNSSSVDSPLTKINRSTYQGLSNKTSEGTPSQYFVQRFIDKVTITLYLTPGSTEAGNTINYYYVKRIQDVGDYTNATDVPYRFVPCMASGLAYYLSQKFKPEMTQQMKLFYEDELQRALAEDGSSSSSFITPKTYYPNV
jgi:hypothetical protein